MLTQQIQVLELMKEVNDDIDAEASGISPYHRCTINQLMLALINLNFLSQRQ